MFTNNWIEKEAAAFVSEGKKEAVNPDLAHRIYSSRLIGSNPDLVMHGGGNTSCKTTAIDFLGANIEVLCVKGSGSELHNITAAGLPAVRLEPLLSLRALTALSDEDMVNVQRANLLDQSSPNPSVETLLHAFLPHKFVDHTHATPFLSLANSPDAETITKEVFGDKLAIVPYVMPGFSLAKTAAEVAEAHPKAEGLLLLQHGHFTWGDEAKSSYTKVIEHTKLIETWFSERRNKSHYQAATPSTTSPNAIFDRLISGLKSNAEQGTKSFVLNLVDDAHLVAQMNAHIRFNVTDRGVATPDHVIRLKAKPLVLRQSDLDGGNDAVANKITKFISDYREYFHRWSAQADEPKTMLDPLPKLVWVESVGIIGIGSSAKEAKMITDLGAQNIRVISDSEGVGGFYPVKDKDLFDMEYWSLEQAKLHKKQPKSLQGQTVMVTGAAGTIGRALVDIFAKQGAEIVAVDANLEALEDAAKSFPPHALIKAIDLTDPQSCDDMINESVRSFGSIDILISNAGTAPQSSILDMDEELLRDSFEVNFFAHFRLAKRMAEHFVRQGNNGQILFNISKQSVNPGRNFGAYGMPKATLLFLMKQLALELGDYGIRVNGVNADRIRSGILNEDFIKSRAVARNVSVHDYMTANLLKQEVEASHVAQAFLNLAMSPRTTAHVITVDGGNIESSLR